MRRLKIAIIAPPWLSLYPGCYYGIENMVHNLATKLTEWGHHVELFTVGGSTTRATKLRWYHQDDQYKHIHRPQHEALSVSIAHLMYALNVIRQSGDFDIIHDHNSFIGPAILSQATDLPPALHTIHEPFTDLRKLEQGIPDNRHMFEQFKSIHNLYFNTVSKSQRSRAPKALQGRIQRVIYNGIVPDEYVYKDSKEDYFTEVASMSPDKGQATAARACHELGVPLKLVGTIGGRISTPNQLQKALVQPDSYANDRLFNYFREEVQPWLIPDRIEYVGKVTGQRQKRHFANARAFLFPIDWEEPFGMAVIEALASGTPVVAYRRGAMPEIIRHGSNGFLANNYSEFKHYMRRVGDIDPAVCRKSVEQKFSSEVMTEAYVDLYRTVLRRYVRPKLHRFVYVRPGSRLISPLESQGHLPL